MLKNKSRKKNNLILNNQIWKSLDNIEIKNPFKTAVSGNNSLDE